jgi:hypothetical protein
MLEGDAVPFVSRGMWDHTGSGKAWAQIAGYGPGDIAHLVTTETLPYLAPAREVPTEVVAVRLFEARAMHLDPSGRILGELLKGDSGSAVVDRFGDLVGLISYCEAKGPVCTKAGSVAWVLP